LAAADEQGVTFLEFAELAGVDGALRRLIGDSDAALETSDDNRHLARLSDELAEYFDGRRDTFTVPVVPRGTDFELKVWEYLRSIPFGQTRSYGQQARAVGSPGAARAVGRANGRNNIAIVIPCHRVIGADGSLTGFGGGLDRKRWLLEHESRASRLL
jgi:O-6-methylguanine DNA methyltransferase